MTETIEQLESQRNALLLRVETATLQRQVESLETPATPLLEAFGDLIDPRERYFDMPRGLGFDARVDQLGDRAGGIYRPHFETEQELAAAGVARWLAATDETAIGILGNLANYTLGTGLTYDATAAGDDTPADLVEAVQDFLHEFQEANRWRRREREAVQRTHRDGEGLLCLEDGYVPRVLLLEPSSLTQPHRPDLLSEHLGSVLLDWTFGVGSDLGDSERVHAYHFAFDAQHSQWDVKPASHIQHIKRNVDFGIKRGLSDFYAAAAEVEQAGKLANNTAEGAAIQATIAYIKEALAGTSKEGIEGARTGRTDWTVSQPIPDGGTRTARYEKFFPGRVITTAGMKYHAGPLGSSQAPTFIDVIQMVLRRVGQRWNMPEYMISGDASNANYSSTLVSESPFVKCVEALRPDYTEEFKEFHWKALAIAERFERFSQWVGSLRQLKRLIKINITGPDIATRNRQEETQIRKTLVDSGVMSRRTWAAEEGLDYDAEIQQGASRIDQ